MLLPTCFNCNHPPLTFPPKTLPKPPTQFPFFFNFFLSPITTFPHNTLRRTSTYTSASASASDTQTLPQSAIQRIADKLRSLGYVEHDNKNQDLQQTLPPNAEGPSPGEIFVPLPTQLAKYRVGHTLDPSWSTPENPVPEPGSGTAIRTFHELRNRALKEKEEERIKKKVEKKEKVPTLAELTVPVDELRRLRTTGIGLKKKLIIGKAGITEGIVNGIHERWRRSELVKIKCEDLCKLNMKRTHDLLEKKTGGFVIWRSGSNIILYRGADYKYPYFSSDSNVLTDASDAASPDLNVDSRVNGAEGCSLSEMDGDKSTIPDSSNGPAHPPLIQGVGSPNRVRFQLLGEAQLADEADRLLEGLGPRFTDWWGCDPLPVDADLLPAVVPGYRRPFRLLPYGVKPKLTNDEMTVLKRLGRPLPCHFALGRNRKLQGLAAAIIRLWEKCEIAKVAIKRGVQNTNSELMAEELKWLTGGTLLSRDKELIVFYRGKDFLPASVSSAIQERRKPRTHVEKSNAQRISSLRNELDETLEVMECASRDEHEGTDDQNFEIVSEQTKSKSAEAAIRRTSAKLSLALEKKAKAEKLLEELGKEELPQQPETDKEGITEEERYMLRKVGLRMKPFLLLGRRGIFSGTVENMHLHWKYRELVKVISGGRSIEEVHGIARTLEAESGGILVAVERDRKGYAIIVYRGKNYKRPASLRPRSLLTKREAMKRSIEAQRRESLKLHVLKLSRNIDELKVQLAKDKEQSTLQLEKQFKPELKAGERKAVDLLSSNLNSHTRTSRNNSRNFQLDIQRDNVPECKDENKANPKPLSVPILDEGNDSADMDREIGDVESKFSRLDFKGKRFVPLSNNAETDDVSDIKAPSDFSAKSVSEQPVHSTLENVCNGSPFKAADLSNRERLLLRKQALKMKKRPVLAVGRSNSITGVAKTINTHFKKYPLAIVNVKGRAEGTSVQEVVFKLQEATGALLISQEPSKVILYRGWGAGKENGRSNGKRTREASNLSAGSGSEGRPVISPQLLSAIRLECGLQSNGTEDVSIG